MLTFLVYIAVGIYIGNKLSPVLDEAVDAYTTRQARKQRNAKHKVWVAARRQAREALEAQMRAEGRWDNFELQQVMNAAGREAVPGYHPLGDRYAYED